MSVTAFTLSEAREMLAAWKACERALASGQAQSYKIGSREFTSVNLNDIRARITYFDTVIRGLTGEANTRRSRSVVFRD